jgi:bifunctional non-homologous end joining protein LigD
VIRVGITAAAFEAVKAMPPECAPAMMQKRSGLKNVSWRATSSLWRRSAPPGFIRPCEPTLVDRPPAGPGWLHEIKHDGFRIVAWKQGERVTVSSRRGADFTGRFSRIADAVRGVSADEAMIDGEAVVFLDDGRSDFRALLTKHGWEQAALVAFDLLRLNGDDLRQRPLEKRREAVGQLIARCTDGIVFNEALAEEGAVVFAKACELGLEGIVSKRAGSLYRSGRSRNWLKARNPEFVRT